MEEWLLCVCVAGVYGRCVCGRCGVYVLVWRQKKAPLQSHLILGSHSVCYFSGFLLVFLHIIDNTNLYSRWVSQRFFRGKKTMAPSVWSWITKPPLLRLPSSFPGRRDNSHSKEDHKVWQASLFIFERNSSKIQCATGLRQADVSFLLKASSRHPELVTRNKHFTLSNPGCSSTRETMRASLALFAPQTVLGITTPMHFLPGAEWHPPPQLTGQQGCALAAVCQTRLARCTQVPRARHLQTCLFSSGCPSLELRAHEPLKCAPSSISQGPALYHLFGWKFLGPGPIWVLYWILDCFRTSWCQLVSPQSRPAMAHPARVSAGRFLFRVWFTETHYFHL